MHIGIDHLRKTVGSLRCLAAGLLVLLTGCHCTNGWIMNNSGMGYYQKGNYSMARNEFERAVFDSPRQPDYRHNLAMAMQKQGDVVMAEQVLRHNLTVDPMHQPTYHALTEILISQQRVDEADQLLAGWRDSQPYLPEAYIEQAWFQQQIGNTAAAEQNLRQALQIKPNHPVALAQMGQIYHQSGQTSQAAAYYQRSLASRWNQPEVRSRLASLNVPSATPSSGTRSAMMLNGTSVAMSPMTPMAPTTVMTAPDGTPFQTVSMSQPVELGAPITTMSPEIPMPPAMPMSPGMTMPHTVQMSPAMPMDSMVPMGVNPLDPAVPTVVDPSLIAAELAYDESPRKLRKHRKRSRQLVAYPLPDFGSVPAWHSAPQSEWITPSPAPIGVPVPSPDSIPIPAPIAPPGTGPTPIPVSQADPAHVHDHAHDHAHEMTAALPIVDPY